MDQLLQQAFERRDMLRQELEALDRFIADYSRVRQRTEGTAPTLEGDDLFAAPSRKRTRSEHAAAVAAMMDAAERLILDAGEPLTRGQLLTRLQAAGHTVEGGDKNKVLGTNLWRSKRFYSIKGAGYWPQSAPIPSKYHHVSMRADAE